jgi:hypothetical protein
MALINLCSLNQSQYKDGEYYAQIEPDTVKLLAQALEAGQLKLNKHGNIDIKGWKNFPKEGGTPYLALKFTREEPENVPHETSEPLANELKEDIPF